MSKIEKIKRVVLIAIGFGAATYLLLSGFAMLEQEELAKGSSSLVEGTSSLVEGDATSKVHTSAVK